MVQPEMQPIVDFFWHFQQQGAQVNLIVAQALLAEAGRKPDRSFEQKLLCLRVFFDMMQSCENVLRLHRVLREIKTRRPDENFLAIDTGYFNDASLQRIENDILSYENRPDEFITQYLGVELTADELGRPEVRAMLEGLHGALRAAVGNLNATSSLHQDRPLRVLYNKLKHGGAVLDEGSDDNIIAFAHGRTPIQLPGTITAAARWCDTVHAMSNTMRNLSNLIRRELGDVLRPGE